MVLEREILPYLQWLLQGDENSWGALPHFLLVVCCISLLALFLGYIFSAARHGLLGGGDNVYRVVSSGFRELTEISWRRIWALSKLAIKEAQQRRAIVALIVFAIVLLFANWFLKTDHQDPARLFISFVLTATTYLLLVIALLLSSFSLPSDFKTKTIFTVVTKPVRAGEIILGRIIGFSIVGTVLLLLMALSSYFFVSRTLSHTHRIESQSLENVSGSTGDVIGTDGRTTEESFHRHDVEIRDENSKAHSNFGHYHPIQKRKGGSAEVMSAEDYIRARVPQWGSLQFLDRQGIKKERGISVGNEWAYRSFIDGNTQAAAFWTFDNVIPPSFIDDPAVDDLEKGLPIGLIVRVFRTHKGIIGQQISGTIQVRKPDSELRSEAILFLAEDAKIDERMIPRKLTSTDGEELDLYEDFVSNGRLEIWVQCLEKGQYFGFAKADCYLRLEDGSPGLNFAKVCLSIWVQMVIVISIGVATSSLVSGPVAMLFTVAFILLGFFREFFVGVALGTEYGGGPVESLVRIVTHKNVMVDLEPGLGTSVIENIDLFLRSLMWSVAQILPDFSAFSTVDFAAYGFDVPAERVFQDLTTCLAYVVGLSVAGYFFLRTREVAK